jgi:hypothetical protein
MVSTTLAGAKKRLSRRVPVYSCRPGGWEKGAFFACRQLLTLHREWDNAAAKSRKSGVMS